MNFRKAFPLSLLALAFFMPAAHALVTGTHGHTTTLLPNGNIFVTGGISGSGITSISDVEIYDMVTNSWSTVGDIGGNAANDRSSHTATLMGDGKVLICGGQDDFTPQSAAYIYNTAPQTWTTIAGADDLILARTGHTATLINSGSNAGNVLVCGGRTSAAGAVTNTCEIFRRADNKFYAAAPMSSTRVGHTASAISGGRVFVSGGKNNSGTYLPNNEIYDPEKDEWQTVDALLQGRAGHTAVVLNNGLIMVSGGYNALNIWACGSGSGKYDEECWYITQLLHLDNVGDPLRQNVGTHGYVDGAEFFDQNGGRVVLSGEDFGVAPYRISRHSAALMPDGKHHIYGGYGNIAPTYFTSDAPIEPGSYLTLSPITDLRASVTSASVVRFSLDFNLSRKISGRLVDANIFFSKPKLSVPPSASISGTDIYLTYTTATVDGMPVGGLRPGRFNNVVQLDALSFAWGSEVIFYPRSLPSIDTVIPSGSIAFVPTTVPIATPGTLTSASTLTLPITIRVPAIYVGGVIQGNMMLTAGKIEKKSSTLGDPTEWSITITTSAMAPFLTTPATLDPADPSLAIAYDNSVTFTGVAGTISNSSASITSAINPAGRTAESLTLTVNYTSTRQDLYDPGQSKSFIFDVSTVIVREMISADNLAYVPATNKWDFMAPGYPVFNHSTLITPAADMVQIGGRNCETNPTSDCLRTNKVFTATTANFQYILNNRSAWPALNKLNTKRAFHTGTLLPDGRILVCGGSDGVKPLSSCELLDPANNKWSYTGSMNYPRARHTATMLPNGTVLLAGGAINASTYAVNTAEIFYPATGRCVNTGSMNTATGKRANHTATLLPDGNVLVAGGNTVSASGSGYSNTSEIYFTTRAVWAAPIGTVPTLTGARAQHTATLLKNGTVLLTGGLDGTGAICTTDIYTFATQSWAAGASLPAGTYPNPPTCARYGHTANLLRDGRVLVSGGSDNQISRNDAAISSNYGASWALDAPPLVKRRTNQKSVLLPNGKVMLTGGETPGTPKGEAESYDPDFSTWTYQGQITNRSNHAMVLNSTGMVLTIGGWNGSGYLDSTELLYFSYNPDGDGFAPKELRNPQITGGDTYFSRGSSPTLLSNTTNFHGFSEASGGGSGSANASFHNPRVYLQQIDNTSGFMTDITNAIYNDPLTNPAWERTLSSITVVVPATVNAAPYGYYHMRVAANGQFSNGRIVQVTMPRPTGAPGKPKPRCGPADPLCDSSPLEPYWRGTSSVTWYWGFGTTAGEINGYEVYAASNAVFIDTVAYTSPASFLQEGLSPNTRASILVAAYNMGGSMQLTASDTFYTLAAPPANLAVTKSEFNSATISWDSNGNSAQTAYQVTMSSVDAFVTPASTAVWFSQNHTSTSAVITNLLPSVEYYFRVQAQNGSFYPAFSEGKGGITTVFSNVASTIAVGSLNNLSGVAMSSVAISWSWKAKTGPGIFFEVYDVSTDTPTPILPSSTTASLGITQRLLSPNTLYRVRVNAAYDNGTYGKLQGPPAYSPIIYTLAEAPTPDPSLPVDPGTSTITLNWQPGSNPSTTTYIAELSDTEAFINVSTLTVTSPSALFTGLIPNTRVSARVRAVNGNGIETAVVTLGTKYTLPNLPASITALKSLSAVALAWSANNNAAGTTYQVIGTTQSDFDLGFSTYMAFDQNYTGTSLSINGLLTDTPYLFAVEASNNDTPPVTSGRTPVPAVIPDGLLGAPSGSIGGTAEPSRAITIHGVLPNGREVTMYVPAGAFSTATGLAISSYSAVDADGPCQPPATPGTPTLPLVAFNIYSEAGRQPEIPITLMFNFTGAEKGSGIGLNEKQIVLARYNPDGNKCLPLETRLDIGTQLISATLNHFSIFQLIVQPSVADLKSMVAYPNPFYTNRGNGYVTIAPVPAYSKIRLYTLSGEKIWEGAGGTNGVIIWKGVNKSGEQVASGIYLAVVESTAGKKIIKLAVER